MSPEEARGRLGALLARVSEAATEQDDSRFLQWRLLEEVGTESERGEIVRSVVPEVVRLASDVFGNFVVQKVLEMATTEQRRDVISRMSGHVFSLATNRFGCRVVQKLFELVPAEDQANILSELGGKIVECIEDMHGNHVVQVAVKLSTPSGVDVVVQAVQGEVDRLADHIYGCRVLQRLIERCPSWQLESIFRRLTDRAPQLVSSQHGNYIAQCILEHGPLADQQRIISTIRGDIVKYAKNKVSSNVVEKCFKVCSDAPAGSPLEAERKALYQAVLGDSSADPSTCALRELATDKFGNYAAQGLIRHSHGAERELVRQRIKALEPMLQSGSGKHLLACWKKMEEEGPGTK